MAKQTSLNLTLGTLLVGALSLSALAQPTPNRVLIIDEGVDLEHNELAGKTFINRAEQDGQAGHDDDNNGFVDDVSGWNAISQDAEYFPARIRTFFKQNAATVVKLLGLYDRVEDGDTTAIDLIRKNPKIGQALGLVLQLSHGTHVGGIVVRYGNDSAELASLNVFTGSQEGQDDESAGSMGLTMNQRFSIGNSVARMNDLARKILVANDESPSAETSTLPFVSRFDDSNGVTEFLTQLRSQDVDEKRLMSRYVASVRPKVANLSLGASKISIRQALDSMWVEDLTKAHLPLTTARTAAQEANYQRMLNETFEIFRASWNQFFRANSNTLFVVAAGNDAGDPKVPNAGDNGLNEVLPANCSKDNANVITVAATTQQGVIADFSNFHSSLVNVAAWGTAVPSLAPNQNLVKMSGTSMAAPNASGVASKIFSVNGRLSPAQVRQILEGTVKKFAALKGRVSSEGMIDAQAAVEAARRSIGAVSDTNVVLAIRGAVQSREAATTTFLSDNPFRSSDKTRVGQVHKTSDVIKGFLR
jgi:subtilisin family serine protease